MLNYIALGLLIFVVLFLFYTIIIVHDIPYDIARKRNHPHQDAIHVAGWVSLLTLHVIWPFLWIWATLYREDRGWGTSKPPSPEGDDGATVKNPEAKTGESVSREISEQVLGLQKRIAELEARLGPEKSES